MPEKWYYSIGGIERGPISSSVLKDLVKRGDLQPNDFVRKEGEAHWRSAGKLRGYLGVLFRKILIYHYQIKDLQWLPHS